MSLLAAVPQKIPSLSFTKAELVYIITKLTSTISPSDNTTRLEMVELRHYCNLIKKEISKAVADGSLCLIPSTKAEPKKKAVRKPTIEELQKQFPTLTAAEIQEILENSNTDKEIQTEPPIPQFVIKPTEQQKPKVKTQKQLADEANAKSFSDLLKSV